MLKNLKSLREDAGVTQKAVAEAIGVSQQSINKYENHNIEPDIETLIRLAQFFHCTVDHLVGYCHEDIQTEQDLTGEEIKLLYDYRGLAQSQKTAVKAIIESYRV